MEQNIFSTVEPLIKDTLNKGHPDAPGNPLKPTISLYTGQNDPSVT